MGASRYLKNDRQMYEPTKNVLDSNPHALMMSPLSSERHSAGAVMAFDGQTEPNFSRRHLLSPR